MSAKTRIYCVSDGEVDRLIRAVSRAQAVGHVARSVYKSRVATQEDIVLAISSGARVEDATATDDATDQPTLEG